MKKLEQLLRRDLARKAQYFSEAMDEITKTNLGLVRTASLLTAFILVLFYFLTPAIISDWRITPQHILFLPAVLAIWAAATLYQRRGRCRRGAVTLLCTLLQAVLLVFVILIDVFSAPALPSSFMPLVCMALPLVFIQPFRQSYAIVLFFEAVYILCVQRAKPPLIAQYDIFASVVGVIFSIAIAQVMLRLRIADHVTRMEYQKRSMQDALAGILNKSACEEAVRQYLEAHGSFTTCCLLVLDVDDFKAVNDDYGHYAGDQLLKAFGALLLNTFRATDIIGRFGGDEFLILLKGAHDRCVVEAKCRAIRQGLCQAAAKGHAPYVTCSIGAALAHRQRTSFEALFRCADDALYEAKRAGKNQCVLRDLPG